MKLFQILMLVGFAASSAMATDPSIEPSTDAIQPREDEKVSYALGMNLGAQIKRVGADVDMDVIAQALKDVLNDKPTQLQPAELRAIFSRAQAYGVAKRKAEGEAFLAKNAKVDGVTVLPDGMQYQVLQAGKGELVKSNEVAVISFRGTWIDGNEFRHEEHVPVAPVICPKGIREALETMKIGSKWRIFVPSDLAYGHQMGLPVGFGSTLIYDLELVSAAPDPDHTVALYGAGRLGHPPGEDFLPTIVGAKKSAPTPQTQQARQNPNIVFPGDTDK